MYLMSILDKQAEETEMKRKLEKARAEASVKAREKGLAEGRAEGREDERIWIAKGMKAKGLPDSMIVELTGLTADVVAGL